MRLIYDLETDGLLDTVTKIHCMVALDSEGKLYEYADQPGYKPISEGIKLLEAATELTGHNIVTFDNLVIKKLFGIDLHDKSKDTLIMARLVHQDIFPIDCKKFKKVPKHLRGRQSLESWGYRLTNNKGDYNGGWEKWSPEMQKYCIQDVMLNKDVLLYLEGQNYSQHALRLEQDFALLIHEQETRGIPFDVAGAERLYAEVKAETDTLHERLTVSTPPFINEVPFTPKRDNVNKGYVAGQVFIKRVEVPFNPGSRQQIVRYLKDNYRWVPKVFTKTGQPQVSDEILRNLPYPEVDDFADYLVRKKLCGSIATAPEAWLKKHRNGMMHGRVNTLGAQSHRCTHSGPNMSQVPSSVNGKYKGMECRSLFHAPKGYKIVGCDASGVQLRVLAHFMASYDFGAYAVECLDGDVHTKNQEDAGIATRDLAKRFIYAFLFGGGPTLLGSIIKPKTAEAVQHEAGRLAIERLMTKNPAIEKLLRDVKAAFKAKGWVRGIDGRKLVPASDHTALNTVIQGGEAVLMKLGAVLAAKEVKNRGLDAYQALHIHDEYQYVAREDQAAEVAWILEWSIAEASKQLDFKCQMEGEAKIGDNWYETH